MIVVIGLAGCGPSTSDRESERDSKPAATRSRPAPTLPTPPPPASRATSPADQLGPLDIPTIAIVVDDWGHRRDATTRGFAELDFPLTFSILPGLRFSQQDAQQATPLALPDRPDGDVAAPPPPRRREIMLHLPMEPRATPATTRGRTRCASAWTAGGSPRSWTPRWRACRRARPQQPHGQRGHRRS
ncbi:MAG: divergent polysaccharide deacetylase family protein [bacterium]|nr:divergent polysaccharide deacetylase family protein [bacterium]